MISQVPRRAPESISLGASPFLGMCAQDSLTFLTLSDSSWQLGSEPVMVGKKVFSQGFQSNSAYPCPNSPTSQDFSDPTTTPTGPFFTFMKKNLICPASPISEPSGSANASVSVIRQGGFEALRLIMHKLRQDRQ